MSSLQIFGYSYYLEIAVGYIRRRRSVLLVHQLNKAMERPEVLLAHRTHVTSLEKRPMSAHKRSSTAPQNDCFIRFSSSFSFTLLYKCRP